MSLPPPAEDRVEKVFGSEQGRVLCISLPPQFTGMVPLPRARGSLPAQAQPLPSSQPLDLSQKSSPPPLVRAEAIHGWVFCPHLGPRSKTLLLFSLPFLPCEVVGQFPG